MKNNDAKEIACRRAWLKPAPGLTVIDPETGKPLPEAGDLVALSKYWRRRLNDGDVVETAPPPPKAPAAVNKPKKEA